MLGAKDARHGSGRLIDLVRAKPVAMTKHGRPMVVALSVEEYERPKALDTPQTLPARDEPGRAAMERERAEDIDKRSPSEDDICTKCITLALRRNGSDEIAQICEEVSFTKGSIIVRGNLTRWGKGMRAA